jgi:hypothetical protein
LEISASSEEKQPETEMLRALALVALICSAGAVSPVQKVVELLDECKAKVQSDLDAEGKAMEEYLTFCDDELKDKGYAIETAGRSIAELDATVEDSTAQILELGDEISTLGTTIAAKEKELADATAVRTGQSEDFKAAEKELVTSVDQLGRAASILKRGMSFAQTSKGKKQIGAAVDALKNIVEASWLDISSKRSLKSFLQASAAAQDDDDLSLDQPQAKQVAYESSSGGIVKTVEEMQGKAEDALSDLRKKETSDVHSFEMVESGLTDEITHGKEKLSTATKGKAANEQMKSDASEKLVETKKSKAADEEYAGTLKTECESKSAEWDARQKSAKAEMGAIEKAKEILVSGVKAFVQVKVSTKTQRWSPDDSDEDDATSTARGKVVQILKNLSTQHHSFALSQLASVASSDPFVKIRGLIEDMIEKLLKEAQEEATQKAFCDEEMGKSTASKEEKTMTLDKLQARIDDAEAKITELSEAVKTLEAEVAEIDSAQAEATKIRTKENEEYKKASKDFKDSAEAVARAIEVLKNFYEGSFIQVTSKTLLKSKQPELGGAKSDTASTIISVLEMSEEDFTTLLAETEATEDEAAKAYKTLTDENKISKATKETEAKAKASEAKSLTVQLGHHKEDSASVSKELDAVLAYLDKLKPQCESKAMSYAERKAAREAEIAGLKEALEILSGSGMALVQTGRTLRSARRA